MYRNKHRTNKRKDSTVLGNQSRTREGQAAQCTEDYTDSGKDGQHSVQELTLNQQREDNTVFRSNKREEDIDGDRGCRWQTGEEGDLGQTVWLASSLALITAGPRN